MSKALAGWLGIPVSLLLLTASQSGRTASFSLPDAPNYNVTTGPLTCTGDVCTVTLQALGMVDPGAAVNSNDTLPGITELQPALTAVPGSMVFNRGSLDSIGPLTVYSAPNNRTDGGATFVSSSLSATLPWIEWPTDNANVSANNSGPGAVGLRFYDGFTPNNSIAFAISAPRPEASSARSEPNPAVPAIDWKTFYLVPPASTAEKAAPGAPLSFYDLQWGGIDGVKPDGTDSVKWGETATNGIRWGGSTVPDANAGPGLPGSRAPTSSSWPPPWPPDANAGSGLPGSPAPTSGSWPPPWP
jgi:hypothetical protein